MLATALLALLVVGVAGVLRFSAASSEEPTVTAPEPVNLPPEALPEAEIEPSELPREAPPPAEADKREPKASLPEPAPPETTIVSKTSPVPGPPTGPFVEAMSAGFAALQEEQFETARDAFSRASEIRPDSSEARDALAQAEQAFRLGRITTLEEMARELEEQEQWRQAVARYDEALTLLPSLELARVGRARSLERAELEDQLEYHLGHRNRLTSEPVFQEASSLLARAELLEPAGPKLLSQRDQLEEALRFVSIPVRAVIESDALTEVIVYRVAELGAFQQKELELRPGSYTVVGRREGFRDVRLRWQIPPGGPAPPLFVRCEEPI